jgi:hypothetical protein
LITLALDGMNVKSLYDSGAITRNQAIGLFGCHTLKVGLAAGAGIGIGSLFATGGTAAVYLAGATTLGPFAILAVGIALGVIASIAILTASEYSIEKLLDYVAKPKDKEN